MPRPLIPFAPSSLSWPCVMVAAEGVYPPLLGVTGELVPDGVSTLQLATYASGCLFRTCQC